MLSFILVIHLIIAIVLIVLSFLQRSEGGGLGIGGSGDFMSGRAVGNVLSRMTAIFATIFLYYKSIFGAIIKFKSKFINH